MLATIQTAGHRRRSTLLPTLRLAFMTDDLWLRLGSVCVSAAWWFTTCWRWNTTPLLTSPSHHVPSLTRVGLLGNIPTDLLQLSRNIDN